MLIDDIERDDDTVEEPVGLLYGGGSVLADDPDSVELLSGE